MLQTTVVNMVSSQREYVQILTPLHLVIALTMKASHNRPIGRVSLLLTGIKENA
jgi:hypothetical protein